MGRMKTIFTDLQLALQDLEFVEAQKVINEFSSDTTEQNELLRAVLDALADWQREDPEGLGR